jgi:hypothetical protein
MGTFDKYVGHSKKKFASPVKGVARQSNFLKSGVENKGDFSVV